MKKRRFIFLNKGIGVFSSVRRILCSTILRSTPLFCCTGLLGSRLFPRPSRNQNARTQPRVRSSTRHTSLPLTPSPPSESSSSSSSPLQVAGTRGTALPSIATNVHTRVCCEILVEGIINLAWESRRRITEASTGQDFKLAGWRTRAGPKATMAASRLLH